MLVSLIDMCDIRMDNDIDECTNNLTQLFKLDASRVGGID